MPVDLGKLNVAGAPEASRVIHSDTPTGAVEPMRAREPRDADHPCTSDGMLGTAISAPWWKSFANVTAIGTLVSALVGGGTWLTNYSIERTKLAAAEENRQLQAAAENAARQDKLDSEKQGRLDKISAEEQSLRTKYVDLALGQSLCIDYRARLFGYLASVLTEPAQKAWAEAERARAIGDRDAIAKLKRELADRREQSVSLTKDLIAHFGKGTLAQPLVAAVETQQKTINSDIERLQSQLEDAAGPPCAQDVQTIPKTATRK